METGRDETRDDFLAAGVRLYGAVSGNLLRGFTSGIVAKEAGYHRQTFYRYWDTQADYVEELIRHLLADRAPAADGISALPSRRGEGQDWDALLRDIARYDYGRMASDPRVAMRLGLVSMQATDSDALTALAQEFHDHVLERLGSAFEVLLAAQGREPVAPLTCRDLARVQQGLLTGLLVQDLAADDDWPVGQLYEEIFGPILLALTKKIDIEDRGSSNASAT